NDQAAETGNAVAPGLAATLPEAAIRITVAQRVHQAVVAGDVGQRRAGVPVAYLVSHADAELVGIRRLEVVGNQVDFFASVAAGHQALQGRDAEVGRVPRVAAVHTDRARHVGRVEHDRGLRQRLLGLLHLQRLVQVAV